MSDYHSHDGPSSPPPASCDGAWRDDAPSRSMPSGRERAGPLPGLVPLVDALPNLGAVLWLERHARRSTPSRTTIGAAGVLLLDHPALVTVGQCSAVTAHTAITPHGPREWLCFRDGAGDTQAKLFLLPDTDYLAWDEMIAANRFAPAPSERVHGAFLRGAFACFGAAWQARLLRFELKRLPWLRTLGARPPLRISLLGLELARTIARAEGAELVSPLHTA